MHSLPEGSCIEITKMAGDSYWVKVRLIGIEKINLETF